MSDNRILITPLSPVPTRSAPVQLAPKIEAAPEVAVPEEVVEEKYFVTKATALVVGSVGFVAGFIYYIFH